MLVLAVVTLACSATMGQTVTSFEGIDASQLPNPFFEIDPNGAVGTLQYMEWVNNYFQAYDKETFAPVWSNPQRGLVPWLNNGAPSCTADRSTESGWAPYDLARRIRP